MSETRIDAMAFDVHATDWDGLLQELHELTGREVTVAIGVGETSTALVQGRGFLELPEIERERGDDGEQFERLALCVDRWQITASRHEATHCEKTVGYIRVELEGMFFEIARWVESRTEPDQRA